MFLLLFEYFPNLLYALDANISVQLYYSTCHLCFTGQVLWTPALNFEYI